LVIRRLLLISLRFDAPLEKISPTQTDALKTDTSGQHAAENCARTRDLGFTTSKHIRMYGEHFELLSDPFEDGGCTAVHVAGAEDTGLRTLRLPVAILVGSAERFGKKQN
jgi:hypothetical protein